ncbi:putative oxidoreductase TM_0325 [Tachypleus tridentatus]|uniref:putative oxidoreductase TM_0325 n=1 Tax=Tachypleus tridentatus TaxID=6853 RepID=UPI003FD32B69
MVTSISTDKKLDQKVAIITGASSGIGRATAVLFSRLGVRLALTGRNQENLTKSAEECKAVSPYNLKEDEDGISTTDILHHVMPLCIIGDLIIESDIERIVKSTLNTYERLDILKMKDAARMYPLGRGDNQKRSPLPSLFSLQVRLPLLLEKPL